MADSLNGNCCDNKIGGQPEVILPLTDSVSVLCLTPLWEYPFNFTHLIETNVYKITDGWVENDAWLRGREFQSLCCLLGPGWFDKKLL